MGGAAPQTWFKDPTHVLEDYPEVDVVMSTDCLASLLDTGEDYFEDVRWSLSEEWNSGAPPCPGTHPARPPCASTHLQLSTASQARLSRGEASRSAAALIYVDRGF